jgi:iron-sulfur cluster assembly accessory protein
MLQEIETTIHENTNIGTVIMTTAAAQAVRNIFAERKLEGYSLRVYVAGGGCCGVNFGMALDNNIRSNDMTFQSEGVQMVVDDQSIAYLNGAKVDFVNDPMRGAGFTVDSPSNTGGSCSCGSGDHSHAEAEGEPSTCACGGSCSCNS